jgi:hypothetical protein
VTGWKEEFHWNNGHPHLPVSINPTQEVNEAAQHDEERQALSYCLGRWLGTYKMKIVHAWVDQHFHAGSTTTSRLDGADRIV